MAQVGHADSKMTMDVYAQLEQRVKRDHGASFDRLVRHARTQLHGFREQRFWSPNGSRDPIGDPKAPKPSDGKVAEFPAERAIQRMARPGLEPGTPRFSGATEGAGHTWPFAAEMWQRPGRLGRAGYAQIPADSCGFWPRRGGPWPKPSRCRTALPTRYGEPADA